MYGQIICCTKGISSSHEEFWQHVVRLIASCKNSKVYWAFFSIALWPVLWIHFNNILSPFSQSSNVRAGWLLDQVFCSFLPAMTFLFATNNALIASYFRYPKYYLIIVEKSAIKSKVTYGFRSDGTLRLTHTSMGQHSCQESYPHTQSGSEKHTILKSSLEKCLLG